MLQLHKGVLVLVAGATLVFAAPLAMAALGDQSIAHSLSRTAVARTLKASNSVDAVNYRIDTVVLGTGTTVTEYVNTAGVVFAVHWTGPVLPDYALLLGSSLPAFQMQLKQARLAGKRGGTAAVSTDGLVVVSAGHMRSFQGYAYLPLLLPDGVDIRTLLQQTSP